MSDVELLGKIAPDGWEDFLSDNGQKLWEHLKAILGSRVRPSKQEPYLSDLSVRSALIEVGQLVIPDPQMYRKSYKVSLFATCDFFDKTYYGFCTGFDGYDSAIQMLRKNAKEIEHFISMTWVLANTKSPKVCILIQKNY